MTTEEEATAMGAGLPVEVGAVVGAPRAMREEAAKVKGRPSRFKLRVGNQDVEIEAPADAGIQIVTEETATHITLRAVNADGSPYLVPVSESDPDGPKAGVAWVMSK